jgi:hypothetical protein
LRARPHVLHKRLFRHFQHRRHLRR